MVPTFPVGDQVESARTMAFFSADLEEPSWSCAAVVYTVPWSTAQLQRLVKPSLADISSCIDKNGHLQWCKNNGKNIYCDFCKIMDSTPGSTPEKIGLTTLHSPVKKWPVESARTMAFFSTDLDSANPNQVVCAMVNHTTAVIGQTKSDAHALQWCKNNGKNIYCDFCKIMDSTPGSTPEKTVWQLSIPSEKMTSGILSTVTRTIQ